MNENNNFQPLILNLRGRRPPPLVIPNVNNNEDDYPDPPPPPVGPRPNQFDL